MIKDCPCGKLPVHQAHDEITGEILFVISSKINTLSYISEMWGVNIKQRKQPVEIPDSTRTDLALLFCELGFETGAEIGVEQGIYSEILLKSNPHLKKLYSIDAWAAYEGYRDHMTQEEMDVLEKNARTRLAPYKNCFPIKGFSLDVAKTFPDESLDFVYLDANHEFTNVVNDLAAWERKVRVGGIIAGHDYIKRKTNSYMMHVPMALHGYAESYQIKPIFVLGRKEQKPGEKRESTRSWFYVKPPHDPMRPGWPGWKKSLDIK